MKRRELRALAEHCIGQFSPNLQQIEREETALLNRAQQLLAERPSVRIAERLQRSTLASVDTPGQSIRSEALNRAGLVTLLDAQKFSNVLERIPDIGGVTAQRIRAIVAKVAQPTAEDFAFFSDPSVWNDHDREFARTIMRLQRLRAARSSSSAVDQAKQVVGLGALVEANTKALSLFSKAKRAAAEAAATSLLLLLQGDSASKLDASVNAVAQIAQTTNTVFARSNDVVDEWRANSASFLVLIEQLTPEGSTVATSTDAVPASRLAIGAPQLLPLAIQKAIENFSLNTNGFKRDLRRYQHFGARFILASGGAILGDEMGLGKTMQALAVAHHLAAEKPEAHILVIAPVSILENWKREAQGATNLEVFMLYGQDREEELVLWERQGGLALTSYQTLRRLPISGQVAIDLTVIDEAHKVKNPEAKQTIAAQQYLRRSRYRLLMSGTPLENRASEFIFLMMLANEDLGATLGKIFGNGETAHLNPVPFRRAVAPGYLRRNQVDVLTELPEAMIQNETVALTPDEVTFYRMALISGRHADARRAVTIGAGGESSKMLRLRELLDDYQEEGRKVLVFSSFLSVLDVAMEVAGQAATRIDGSVPTTARQQVVDDFSNKPGFAVLVMQIDVGGVGLNIQAASVVIVLEPQWKPSTETQAIGRSFRMGQTRRVNVHRLLASNSIDERIEERQRGKERIFNAIVRSSHLAESMDDATDSRSEDKGLAEILSQEARRLSA